MTNFISCSNI